MLQPKELRIAPIFASFSWLGTRWVYLYVLIVETGHDEIKPSILSQLDDERQFASAAIQRVPSQDKEGKPLQIFLPSTTRCLYIPIAQKSVFFLSA